MKKTLSLLAAAVCGTMMLVACDPEELVKEIIEENSGNVSMVAANGSQLDDQQYKNGDTVKLGTVLCGTSDDGVVRVVGIRGSLLDEQRFEGNNFPVININLTGNGGEGTYNVSLPIDNLDFLNSIASWGGIGHASDTMSSSYNFLFLAVSNDSYYLAKEAEVEVTEMGEVGGQVKGEIKNAVCKYITSAKINHIHDLKTAIQNAESNPEEAAAAATELATINVDTYFPEITFNGSFSALRADISGYARAISRLNEE
ncbi:MAG: hypothetical protein IJU19_01850 [Bacteroidales bacterium]|nr:hypothetical protein [Bacteroidales bacterium]